MARRKHQVTKRLAIVGSKKHQKQKRLKQRKAAKELP